MEVGPNSNEGSWDQSNFSPQWIPSSVQVVIKNENFRDLQIVANPSNYPIHLAMKVEPESRFRYRYDTEMSGTHGSLQGVRIGREKSVPTVELVGYSKPAVVRVSLVTCNSEGDRFPHPHSLFVKEKMYQKRYTNFDDKKPTKTGHFTDPHYILLNGCPNDYMAKFEKMCIISTKKEKFRKAIIEKLKLAVSCPNNFPVIFDQFCNCSGFAQRRCVRIPKRLNS